MNQARSGKSQRRNPRKNRAKDGKGGSGLAVESGLFGHRNFKFHQRGKERFPRATGRAGIVASWKTAVCQAMCVQRHLIKLVIKADDIHKLCAFIKRVNRDVMNASREERKVKERQTATRHNILTRLMRCAVRLTRHDRDWQ